MDRRYGLDIKYADRQRKDILINSLHNLSDSISTKPNVSIKIASVPPSSLFSHQSNQRKKNHYYSPLITPQETFNQQTHLEEDIKYVNEQICLINSQNHVHNIHLDKDLIRTSIKKRGTCGQKRKKIVKFVYDKLDNGVHPNFNLKQKWFSVLCNSVHEFFTSFNDQDSDISEDEESESWDFKRF